NSARGRVTATAGSPPAGRATPSVQIISRSETTEAGKAATRTGTSSGSERKAAAPAARRLAVDWGAEALQAAGKPRSAPPSAGRAGGTPAARLVSKLVSASRLSRPASNAARRLGTKTAAARRKRTICVAGAPDRPP